MEGLQDWDLGGRQLLIEFDAFFFYFLVFAFLFSTNTDRQTDKPKSRFQESTEAQAELL